MAAWIIMSLGMELGLSPGDFVLDGDPAPTPKGGRTYSTIFGPFLLWPNGWMHQDAIWYGCRPQPRGLCVRWRPSPPPQKWGAAPHKFSAYVYCGQTAEWIKMPLGTMVGLSPGDSVLDEDPAPLPKRRQSPQFSAHVYCGQTAEWIKMALGMEVGLGPVHIVLDGDTAPLPKKGTEPPHFRPIFIVAKRLHGSRCHLVRG